MVHCSLVVVRGVLSCDVCWSLFVRCCVLVYSVVCWCASVVVRCLLYVGCCLLFVRCVLRVVCRYSSFVGSCFVFVVCCCLVVVYRVLCVVC